MSGTSGKYKVYAPFPLYEEGELLMASYETEEEALEYIKKFGKPNYYIK